MGIPFAAAKPLKGKRPGPPPPSLYTTLPRSLGWPKGLLRHSCGKRQSCCSWGASPSRFRSGLPARPSPAGTQKQCGTVCGGRPPGYACQCPALCNSEIQDKLKRGSTIVDAKQWLRTATFSSRHVWVCLSKRWQKPATEKDEQLSMNCPVIQSDQEVLTKCAHIWPDSVQQKRQGPPGIPDAEKRSGHRSFVHCS